MTNRRMQPTTASAFGAIALLYLVMSSGASEIESNGIGHGIDFLVVDDQAARSQAVEGVTDNANTLANENDISLELASDYAYPATSPNRLDASNNATTESESETEAQLQRDQSEDLERTSSPTGVPTTTDFGLPQKTAKTVEAYSEPTSATWSSPVESENTSNPGLDDLPFVLASREPDHRTTEEQNLASSTTSTSKFASTTREEDWLLQPKSVLDIKAISFQIPQQQVVPDQRRDKTLLAGKSLGSEQSSSSLARKNHSKPTNNLVIGGKTGSISTKEFYEIKPSMKSETDRMGQEQGRDRDASQHLQTVTSTTRSLFARKFVLPSVDSPIGKFGPYFEDGDQEMNITARIGSTVLLDCKIGMLGDKKVTWLQHSKDSFRLLTVGKTPYSVDQRISLNFRYPSNWRLQILYATPRDSGLYKCQVATHPPLIKEINVIITAPELTITDDSGRVVPKERHLKAGSALKLRCEARDILETFEESVVWTRGDETLAQDVSENRTSEVSEGKEVLVIVSTLVVERASPRHAGNYSCVVPGKAKTTIAVHVLNGELPAAVHDGNGVSRAFLNLWLIHLTMSYVFSR